jgi:hypothetical protein
MRTTSSYSDYQPLGHIGRLPIHITTILTTFFVVGLILFALLGSAGVRVHELFGFDPETFSRGRVWTPATYAFFSLPDFFSAFGLFCFYRWAIEVERYLGRARFVKFFVMLVFLGPLVVGLWHLAGRDQLIPLIGNYDLIAAVLIAFATLYPNVEFFGWIPLKWFAFVCVALGSLMYFPQHDWISLSLLLTSCGAAFGYVRFLQSGGSVEFGDLWEKIDPFKRRPKLRVLPSPHSSGRDDDELDEVESIDPLLDKIARTGIASLTARERARLEKARAALLKKDRR